MESQTQDTPEGAEVEDEMLDIDPAMRGVVEKYGREMFTLVMQAGLASQATQVLAGLVGKHQSQHSAHALGVLSQAFNEVSTQLCRIRGWDEGMLGQCDRDIQLAFRGKLVVAGERLVLDS